MPEEAVSYPRLIDELREQLAETEALRREFEEAGVDDFASEVNLGSIRALEAEMRDELDTVAFIESEADAELAIEGGPVHGHSVSAGFLGDFLRSAQNLVYAVAQVRVGQPTSRAPVQSSIITAHQLILLPQFVPGSFGLRLRLPREEELGVLPGALDESRMLLTLVGDVLSDNVAADELATLLAHARVKSHYRNLMGLLAEQNADLAVRTRARPQKAVIRAQRARERREWLSLLQATTETVVMDGRLVGGNIERRRFELAVDGETYAGTVSEQAASQMQQLHWGDTVQASIAVTTTEHEEWAGEPRVEYYAESFAWSGSQSSRLLPAARGRRIRLED